MKTAALAIMVLALSLGLRAQEPQPKQEPKIEIPKGGVITQDDFRRILTSKTWTWVRPDKAEITIRFNPDGTAISDDWRARYQLYKLNEVQLRVDKQKRDARLVFAPDYTSYQALVEGRPFTGRIKE